MKMSKNWAIAALAATALTVGTTPLEAYPSAARAMQPASVTSPDVAELQRGGKGGARGGGQSAGTRSAGGAQARAAGGGGGGANARPTRQAGTPHNVRSTSGSNINSANRSANRNTNRNVNRNTNINRDVNVDVDGGWGGGGYGYGYHPIAAGVAIGATAAVVGSIVNSPPSTGCVTQIVNGISYTQCGSTWYQPQYSGTNVEYIVVNAP